MKRIISIASALTLIVALTLNASAAITLEECKNLVGGIGLIDNESYKGEKTVLRGEFAEILTNIMGIKGNTLQDDLDNLYALKAMGKDISGSFRENEPLSYNEAILGLLTAAGFGGIASLSGGYPKGYEKTAVRYGVVCGKTGSEGLTYDDLSELIYKTLYLPSVETTYKGTKPEFYINDEESAMFKLFDLDERSGIMTACGETNLYSQNGLADNMIAIDGQEYRNTYELCNLMVGKYVTVFLRIENGEPTAIFAYEGKRNSVKVISEDNEPEYNPGGQYYTYTENNKKKSINIKGAHILYNGFLPESSSDMVFVPDNGWIELIDNNSDSKADVVKIHSYTNLYITGITREDDGVKLYGEKTEPVLVTADSDSGNTDIYTASGEKLKLKNISQGMVVSVFSYKKNGELKAKTIYNSDGEIRGFISGLDSENSFLAIDEVYYRYDKALQSEIDLLMLGTYRSFFKDYRGKLAYINHEVADDNNKGVGYIVKTAQSSGLNKSMDVKIYDAGGIMRTLSARDKLYVDGELKKGDDAIKTALEGKTGMAAYTMYDDGRIRSVDFPENKNYADNDTLNPLNHLVKVGGGTNIRFRLKGKIWGGNMVCNENARIIILPSDASSADESEFSVKNVLSEVFRDDGSYDIECYSYNNNGIGVDYIVYTLAETWMEPTAQTYVIKDIKYEKNDDGDYLPVLQIIGAAGTVKYTCKDNSVFDNVTTFTGISSSATPGIPCEKPEKGDVIKISLNMEGKITDIRMIYDADKNSFTPVSPTSYFSASHVIKGRVYDKANGIALVTTRPDVTDMEGASNSEFEAYILSLFKIIKVGRDGEVNVVKPEEVKAYKKNNGEYSEVITALTSGIPSIMVIYEQE